MIFVLENHREGESVGGSLMMSPSESTERTVVGKRKYILWGCNYNVLNFEGINVNRKI